MNVYLFLYLNRKPESCTHRAANICALQSRRFCTHTNQGDIQNNIQHRTKVSTIEKIFKFAHQNMDRLVYFQGTFCRIRASWQLCVTHSSWLAPRSFPIKDIWFKKNKLPAYAALAYLAQMTKDNNLKLRYNWVIS